MKNWIFPTVLFTGIGLYIYKQIQNAKKVNINLRSINPKLSQLREYGFEKLPVEIGLSITNTTAFILNVNTIKLDIFINNRLVSTILQNKPINIKGNETTPFKLIGLIELQGFDTTVNDLINIFSKNSKNNIFLKGFVDTSLGRYNIAKSIEL
jgi:hypothetical protein